MRRKNFKISGLVTGSIWRKLSRFLIYMTNKLHHRKCFVRILFTRCKTLETHSFATLTRSFLKFRESWIKTRTAHFLWSNLFIYNYQNATYCQYLFQIYPKNLLMEKRRSGLFFSRLQPDALSHLQSLYCCDTTHLQLSLNDKCSSLELLGQHQKSMTDDRPHMREVYFA